jgi:hypothetical protein
LLELPVEHVLATHGGPHDRAAVEHALSASGHGKNAVGVADDCGAPTRAARTRRCRTASRTRASR